MARPREFERDEVIDKALGVFWMQGYAATSMSDLLGAVGIGRQSLYNAFGGKHDIFMAALRLYVRRNREMVDRLLVPELGLAAIRAYLFATARNMSSFPRKACFLFNTCVELGPHDAEARELLESGLLGMRQGFGRCLALARASGELSTAGDDQQLVVFLSAQVGGMAALARAGASSDDLEAVAASAMLALH